MTGRAEGPGSIQAELAAGSLQLSPRSLFHDSRCGLPAKNSFPIVANFTFGL